MRNRPVCGGPPPRNHDDHRQLGGGGSSRKGRRDGKGARTYTSFGWRKAWNHCPTTLSLSSVSLPPLTIVANSHGGRRCPRSNSRTLSDQHNPPGPSPKGILHPIMVLVLVLVVMPLRETVMLMMTMIIMVLRLSIVSQHRQLSRQLLCSSAGMVTSLIGVNL